MKIGIFGGCFNPPHLIHYELIKKILENKIVDKVIVVPTGNSYEKQDLIPIKHRYKMLKIMFKDLKNVEISNFEDKKSVVYTYQTLDYFKSLNKNDEICFICGQDNIIDFVNWKNYDYILKHYKVIVVTRNGINLNYDNEILKQYNSSIKYFDLKLEKMSSTFIRENIKNFNKINFLMNENVIKYINKNNLYNRSKINV